MTDDEFQARATHEAAEAIGAWLEECGRLDQPIHRLTMPELEAMATAAIRLERPTDESDQPFPPGFVHLPKVDEEYLKQLTAERLVERKDRRGFRRLEWEKTRERNEALDARVYARAAAWLERLDAMDSRAVIRCAARHRVAEAPPVIPIEAQRANTIQTPPSGGVPVSGVRRREWLDRRRGWLR